MAISRGARSPCGRSRVARRVEFHGRRPTAGRCRVSGAGHWCAPDASWWSRLDSGTERALVAALESTRVITPGFNNWLLFSAMVEAGLAVLGARVGPHARRLCAAPARAVVQGRRHLRRRPGSFIGTTTTASSFSRCCSTSSTSAAASRPRGRTSRPGRAAGARYAAVQERLIAPEGTFPPSADRSRTASARFSCSRRSRSGARCRAAFAGAGSRRADRDDSAIDRGPGTFDADGWLRIGFCGHQPGVGESYISTGSLYLCARRSAAARASRRSDEFWAAPAQPWTSVRAWTGQAFPIDKAL